MTESIIALSSYGSHRVKNAHTGQMVSAYKMGYTSAASAVLLALYGSRARDVSSKQASYHYIQIDAEVIVRHGHILLKITGAELAQAEALTRQVYRPAVYRWMDGAWLEFPNLRQPDYTPIVGRSGPNFNPTGMLIVAAATGAAEAAIEGITVEKSQRDPNEKAWFWIRGDTYPHRDTLKRWGCRWSKKRKAWYYTGWQLPAAVQQMIDDQNTVENGHQTEVMSDEDADPCPVEEAAAILGMRVKNDVPQDQPPQDGPPRLFDLNETVYTRHNLETPDGKPVPTGTRGTIIRLYNRNPTHGWSYDVDFIGIGVSWFFERELTSLEPVPGIRITRGSVVPPGAAPLPSDAEIKQALIEGGHQPKAIDPDEGIVLPSGESEETADEVPKVRVIKPALDVSDGDEPDAVLTAIRQTKAKSLPVLQPSSGITSGRRALIRIPQSPCGELTGSITGNVWCYGWSIHDGICVYVNMGGPRMAVEAIRAKLSKGDIVSCVPWDAPAMELTAGEGNTGMYSAFMQNIPEAKFTSLILLHEMVTQPNYGGSSTTFLFHVSDEQAMAQLRHHITKLVKVPVFSAWTSYLWHAGQSAMLLRPTRTGGDVKLYTIVLDSDSWTRLLTGGLAQGIISLPQNA
ncbi:MAG: hypothetical protein JW910_11790 [Anaerolineae bacterium]|nr:hypothetical protein [Anaerolineae bacterium]